MTIQRAEIESTIFTVVDELLETIESDYEEDVDGNMMLIADGGFSSIDFVQMTVMIESELKRKVGYQDMLMQNGRYVDDLSVGAVVDFTLERLNAPEGSQSAAPAQQAKAHASESGTSSRVSEDDLAAFTQLVRPRHVQPTNAPRNKRAVFILSPPRSGSTLLRVMMAGNSSLLAPPELHLLSYPTLADRHADLNKEHVSHLLDGTVRALMQTRDWSAEQARALIEDCKNQGMSTHEFFGVLQEGIGDKLLVDKTPTYAFSLDILRQAEACFDNPLYVHLTRHPCGMIRSYTESNLPRMMPMMMRASEFSTEAVAEITWLLTNRNILQFGETVPSDRWLPLSYEHIVSQPEQAMRTLCEFMDVDYEPDMIDPYRDSQSRMTDGVDSSSKMSGDLKFHLHSQIDPAAATRWKQFMSEDQLGEPTLELASRLRQGEASGRF